MNNNEEIIRKSIGKKIKLARSQTTYTQEQLAEKLSLSSKYISQLERGVSFGSASTIVNICKALNISSDFLFNDLIKIDSDLSSDVESINTHFLKTYIQLDTYNKDVLNIMANQLLNLQKNNNKH